MSKLRVLLVTAALVLSLALASLCSYKGFGVKSIGTQQLRAGSIYGPGVTGGGPGAGK
jgi:hypothetical protein